MFAYVYECVKIRTALLRGPTSRWMLGRMTSEEQSACGPFQMMVVCRKSSHSFANEERYTAPDWFQRSQGTPAGHATLVPLVKKPGITRDQHQSSGTPRRLREEAATRSSSKME